MMTAVDEEPPTKLHIPEIDTQLGFEMIGLAVAVIAICFAIRPVRRALRTRAGGLGLVVASYALIGAGFFLPIEFFDTGVADAWTVWVLWASVVGMLIAWHRRRLWWIVIQAPFALLPYHLIMTQCMGLLSHCRY